MRDEQTGTYWQQISGKAISGPLAGRQLTLVPSDELSLALWKTEEPAGAVLDDVPTYAPHYAAKDWDIRMSKAPAVLSFPESGHAPRDLMLGVRAFGSSRAFPYELVLKDTLVQDHLGDQPIMLVVGPDNQSVRAFRRRIPNVSAIPDFYRDGPRLLDSVTGSQWDFRGCAVSGKSQGACLDRIQVVKDYWFDWRNYNPATTVYRPR